MSIGILKPTEKRARLVGFLLLGAFGLFLVAGGMSIPFFFESFSIKYKFGFHRALLRSGKVIGIVAGVLLFLQLVLVSRLGALNRWVGMDQLVQWHRKNGIFLAFLALSHPLFIFGPEDIQTLPISWEFWPEVVGALLLMGLFYMVASGLLKTWLAFPFHLWMRAHRFGGGFLILAFFVHLLFSSESFEEGLPRLAGLVLALASIVLLLWRHLPFFRPLSRWAVSGVFPAGVQTTQLVLSSEEKKKFLFFPGQFVFLQFFDSEISSEAHPFTVASAPTSNQLEFFIGSHGDWTSQLKRVKAGDAVRVEGPYGRFSYLVLSDERPLLFIAGGVGVTPMLSMLRFLKENDGKRRVRLVWSVRTPHHLFCVSELSRFQESMDGFSMHLLFSHGLGGRRLDQEALSQFVEEFLDAEVFLCGPPPMMRDVGRILVDLGIGKSRIYTEVFGF